MRISKGSLFYVMFPQVEISAAPLWSGCCWLQPSPAAFFETGFLSVVQVLNGGRRVTPLLPAVGAGCLKYLSGNRAEGQGCWGSLQEVTGRHHA